MVLDPTPRARTAQRKAAPILRGLEPHEYDPDGHPVEAYLERLGSPASRAGVTSALRVIAEIASGGAIELDRFPWHRVTYRQALRLRSELVKRYEPAGVNLKLSALRGVVRECFLLELVSGEHLERIRQVRRVAESGNLRGREAAGDELRKLAEVCRADPRAQGPRDFAVFSLLAGLGLRAGEVVRLQLSAVDLEAGVLTVKRKGARAERLPLTPAVISALEAWLAVRGRGRGPLFYACDHAGGVRPKGIGRQAVGRLVERRRREAQLPRLTPHDLRRTVAGRLLDRVDVGTAKAITGHRKTDTLLLYDRRPMERAREAALQIENPFG